MSGPSSISPKEQEALRSWLRLLGASNQIRKDLQSRLQAQHGISLSRFDILANLYRAPEKGIRLSELSKQLMVSNGNVTQVMAPLIKEGLIERQPCADDARAAMAKLSSKGRAFFETVATDHAAWVSEIFTSLTGKDHGDLATILDKLTQRQTSVED